MQAFHRDNGLLVFRAVKPPLNAALAGACASALILLALFPFGFDSSIRWLSGIGSLFFLVAAMDSAVPIQVKIVGKTLAYRNTFFWKHWELASIAGLRLMETTWLGRPAVYLALDFVDGAREDFHETLTPLPHDVLPGGVTMVAESLGRRAGIPVCR